MLSKLMLRVNMLIGLIGVMLCVITLSIVKLSVVMLSLAMQSVIVLSVVAPFTPKTKTNGSRFIFLFFLAAIYKVTYFCNCSNSFLEIMPK